MICAICLTLLGYGPRPHKHLLHEAALMNHPLTLLLKPKIIYHEPMTQKIYIGMDGGGTTCRLRMENAEGRLLATAKGGAANISVSVTGALASLRQALRAAFYDAGINPCAENFTLHAGLALAGTENKAAVAAFTAKLNDFYTYTLISDAHAACAGAHAGQDGAIIISGTGVIGYAIRGMQTYRVSGWGFSLGEVGSGAWLGYEAVRWMLAWRDGRCASTPLLQKLFKTLGADIMGFSATATGATYARLVPLIMEYATDTVTQTLSRRAAQEIDVLYRTLSKGKTPLPLCLLGGVMPYLKPYLSTLCQQRTKPPVHDAATGAIQLLRKQSCH